LRIVIGVLVALYPLVSVTIKLISLVSLIRFFHKFLVHSQYSVGVVVDVCSTICQLTKNILIVGDGFDFDLGWKVWWV
jgi:hypothetical protein